MIVVSTDYPELTRVSTIDGEGDLSSTSQTSICRRFDIEELNNLLNQSFKGTLGSQKLKLILRVIVQ